MSPQAIAIEIADALPGCTAERFALEGNTVLTGSSRARGFEAALVGQLAPHLQVTLGYALQDGEIRTTTLSAKDAADAIEASFTDGGLEVAGTQDLGIADTIEIGFYTADGELVIVVIMGAGAFDTDELGSAKASVPPDTTVVLIAYLPQ